MWVRLKDSSASIATRAERLTVENLQEVREWCSQAVWAKDHEAFADFGGWIIVDILGVFHAISDEEFQKRFTIV